MQYTEHIVITNLQPCTWTILRYLVFWQGTYINLIFPTVYQLSIFNYHLLFYAYYYSTQENKHKPGRAARCLVLRMILTFQPVLKGKKKQLANLYICTILATYYICRHLDLHLIQESIHFKSLTPFLEIKGDFPIEIKTKIRHLMKCGYHNFIR